MTHFGTITFVSATFLDVLCFEYGNESSFN